jgi:lipoprotein NlpD
VALVISAAAVLAACATGQKPRAPVEDRSAAPRTPAPAVGTPSPIVEAPRVPAGVENAGKPGFYTVRPGYTLIRVGLETGQNWRDIQRWNNLDNPDRIEVGQVLRVIPPGQDGGSTAARPVGSSRVEGRPLDSKPQPASAPVAAPPAPAPAPAASPAVTAPPPPPPPPPAAQPAARDGDDDLSWQWPALGPVVASFDEVRNKGLSIGGKPGDAVLAAADGRVVYAGSSLRGYGNLIIVKHNETYLTAYAHNQQLLVKEDQLVRRGQKIAEMGSSDSDRVQLHFEIRRKGKPIDPTRLLPSR